MGEDMKKISLEYQWAIGKKTGVGWYIYNIVKELSKSSENKYILEFVNFFGKYNSDLEKINYNLEMKQNKFITYKVYDFLAKKINLSHNMLMRSNSDIYHFFNFTIPSNIKGKVIVTIYDTVFITAPETMGNKKRIEDYIYGAEKSDLIITISESAKMDIVENLGINEDKIKIVTPGIDIESYSKEYSIEELNTIKDRYQLPDNYILYLGTVEPRKNIERIIKAFLYYKKNHNGDLKLIIAGGMGWNYKNITDLIESNSEDIILTGYVREEDKIPIYKLSKVFVFPSLYEGFGMPVLEAMASGIPVITSNVSSLPEVAGDAAIKVNPLNEIEIFNAYEKVLLDSNLREKMIRAGYQQSKKYSWKESAIKLEKIYRDL